MEKEKQRRRFGRAEIILIIQLVTIFAMIYLFSSCSNKNCFNPFNRPMSNVVLDTIYPLQFPNSTYGNSIWNLRKHFSIIKINHHEYIFYDSRYQAGLCHYEDCEYCNNNNP